MDIYLINLDHRTDRMANMQTQLDQMELAFTRVSAVNGLGDADIGYPADHPRLSKSEFACYLSHRNCWQALIESGAARCLILEDDIVFAANFKSHLLHKPYYAHSGCVTRLECRPYRTFVAKLWLRSFKGVRLRRLMAYDGGTGAYVLTREYAAYLLKNHSDPKVPVDDQVLDPEESNFRPHKIYQLDPALAIQQQFLSKDTKHSENGSDLDATRVTPENKRPEPNQIAPKLKAVLARRWLYFQRNVFQTCKAVPFLDEK